MKIIEEDKYESGSVIDFYDYEWKKKPTFQQICYSKSKTFIK